MTTVTLDERRALDLLTEIRSKIADMAPAHKRLARITEQLIRDTFRDETDPWGSPWPAHSPVTIAQRRRRAEASVQMLLDSGALYSSIATQTRPDGIEVSAGEGLAYGAAQQFGNPANRAWGRATAPIPARAYFPLRTPDDAELPGDWWQAITSEMDAYVREAAA